MLYLIGLGVNSKDLSFSAYEIIKSVKTVVLRTEKTISANFLKENKISYISLDNEYDRSRNFDTLSKNLALRVKKYLELGDVAYLVDGAVSDDKSSEILIKSVKNVEIFEGVSKAKSALSKLKITSPSYTAFSAYDKINFSHFSYPLVVYDLDSQPICSEWKLTLSDIIGEDTVVYLLNNNTIKQISLFEIDREKSYDYQTAVVITDNAIERKKRFDFYNLIEILIRLRQPDGCPWDKVQTKESIRKNLIEECYELVDAINLNDDDKMLEEIGDVLMQAAFHMQFGVERGAFSYFDVTSEVCEKLVFRHSHVFGQDKTNNADGALDIWDKNKQIEKGFSSPDKYVLDVPKNFPSLIRLQKIFKRVSKYVDEEDCNYIDNITTHLSKLKEETNDEKIALLVAVIIAETVLVANKYKVDAEEVLANFSDKYSQAFSEKYKEQSLTLCKLIKIVLDKE